MNSIKRKLSLYLSLSLSVLLVAILLATDISVDRWVSAEFDRAMKSKVGLLETLVIEDETEVDFEFAGEFMPEFEGRENPEYFELWYNNKVFERSDTLEFFEVKDLPKHSVKLNEFAIKDISLPDGRAGRMLFTKFLPQVDSVLRDELGISRQEFAKRQKPIELAYALSKEELNHVLWFVDIIFICISITAVFAVKKIVFNVVERLLKPIDNFSAELSKVNLNSKKQQIAIESLPIELMPIAKGVNHFIEENQALYMREKRVTSDIAHELKTPISELLNLSEVALKFPHEKQITNNFTNDVKDISTRLKNIVNGILLLQKSSNNAALDKSDIAVLTLLETIIKRENKSNRRIHVSAPEFLPLIVTNEIALETILSNLINNALFYSPTSSSINVNLQCVSDSKIKIEIANSHWQTFEESDLNQIFEPLWQKDSSRTSTQRYGLGLAIVKSYCEKINADISVALCTDNKIIFTFIV
ncbi:MAG: sensor histidine kinase [Paraglaciecola sp.]